MFSSTSERGDAPTWGMLMSGPVLVPSGVSIDHGKQISPVGCMKPQTAREFNFLLI